MEAVIMAKNQSVSGCNNYKQTRASRKKKNDNNTRSFTKKSSENQAPPSFHGSLLQTPHRSLSFSPSSILSHPYHHQQKPPLLPLPVAATPMYRSSSLSSPPPRDQSVNAPRKRRSQPKPIVVAATPRLGPGPADRPKEASKVLTCMESPVVAVGNYLESFSGAFSILSPPPSSLPLPRFPLRPARAKLSCNAEVDAGATDDLRRLLRFH